MLLILSQWLQDDFGFLRVFNYITFRAVMATVTALLIGLAWKQEKVCVTMSRVSGQSV